MAESYKAPIDSLVSPGSRDKLRTQDIESLSQDPLRAIKESYRSSFFESENFQEGERLAEVLAIDMGVKLPSDLNYFGNTAIANQYGTRTWISAICRLLDQDGAIPDPDQTYESPDGTGIVIPFKETTRLRANIGKFYAPLEDIKGKGALNIQVGDWLVVEHQDKLLRNNGIIKDVYLKKDLSTWRPATIAGVGGGGGGGESVEGGLVVTGQPIVGCPNGPTVNTADLAGQFGARNGPAIFGIDPYCFSSNPSFEACNFKPPCAENMTNPHKKDLTDPDVVNWLKEVISLLPDVPPSVIAAFAIHEGGIGYLRTGGKSSSYLQSGMLHQYKPLKDSIKGKTRTYWNQIPARGWSKQCQLSGERPYCNYGFGLGQLDATVHDVYSYYEKIGDWDPTVAGWMAKTIEAAFVPPYKLALRRGVEEPAAIAIGIASYNGGYKNKIERYNAAKEKGDMASAWAAIDAGTCGGAYGTSAFVLARFICCAAATDPAMAYLKG